MERPDLENFEMIQRVVHFGSMHVDLFPPETKAGSIFNELAQTCAKAFAAGAEWLVARNSVSATSAFREKARSELRIQLQRIRVTAKAIAIERPGMADPFRLPKHSSDKGWVEIAMQFSNKAEFLKSDFIAHHLPDDFIQNLQAGAEALTRAITDQEAEKTKRDAASQTLKDGLRECLVLLKRCDVIVENTLVRHPEFTAEWETARHVVHRRGRKGARKPAATSDHAASAPN